MKNQEQELETSVIYGDNTTLAKVILTGRKLSFGKRVNALSDLVTRLNGNMQHIYFRSVQSKADREVIVRNKFGGSKKMLMFGSNNYLGLATHPHVVKKVKAAIDTYGVGIDVLGKLDDNENLDTATIKINNNSFGDIDDRVRARIVTGSIRSGSNSRTFARYLSPFSLSGMIPFLGSDPTVNMQPSLRYTLAF